MRAIIVGKGTVKEILRMQEKLTEKEKLQNGMWYDANFDPELIKERQIADAAGLFFLVGAFVTILSRPVFGRLFDKFGDVSCHYLCLVKPFNPCYGKFCVFSGDLSYFPWLRFK